MNRPNDRVQGQGPQNRNANNNRQNVVAPNPQVQQQQNNNQREPRQPQQDQLRGNVQNPPRLIVKPAAAAPPDEQLVQIPPPPPPKGPNIFERLREGLRSIIRRWREWRRPAAPLEAELPWNLDGLNDQLGDFIELIEKRFDMVKRRSSKAKYNAKIGLQVFIYIINILEIIFTLHFGDHNFMYDREKQIEGFNEEMFGYNGDIKDEDNQIFRLSLGSFQAAYILSIIFCVAMHCFAWCYTYKYKQTQVQNIFMEIIYFIAYTIFGGLSYFKLAPFLFYFTRNKKIPQFSFSQINKYLLMTDDDRFRNPTGLFKERTKPVNMFRDLIFHRFTLLSMMITLMLQTIPQLFIQGFFCTAYDRWDAFNVFSILFLIGGTIYALTELQLMVFTTSYRTIQSELQFKLKKVKLLRIQETKQLFKANSEDLKTIKQYHFHIDPRNFSLYEKRRCMIQLIKFLLTQKQLNKLEILYLEHYEDVLLRYFATYLRHARILNIRVFCENQEAINRIQNIIQNNQINFLVCDENNLKEWWEIKDEEGIDEAALLASVIEIVEQQPVNNNRGITAVIGNQAARNFLPFKRDFRMYIPQDMVINLPILPPDPNWQVPVIRANINRVQIITEAQQVIADNPKALIIRESLGILQQLADVYEYFQAASNLNWWQHVQDSLNSIWNSVFSIIQLVFIGQAIGPFSLTLILATAFVPLFQITSFAIFYHKIYPHVELKIKIPVIIMFAIFNFIKVWNYVMTIMYLCFKNNFPEIVVPFTSDAYEKFKSYAAKFKGTLAIVVFQYETELLDPNSVLSIQKLPFYKAVTWRASVEETILKVIQFTIYILSLVKDPTLALVLSIIQSLKEGLVSIWSMVSVLLKDYFIPALVLRNVSVEQFFQSLQFLGSISHHIYLEFPMSFAKLIKANSEYIRQRCSIVVEVRNLDYSNYKPLKLKKSVAQMKLALSQVQNLIEFNSAQRFFVMGPQLHDVFECLRASWAHQMKFNFNLEEVDPLYANHINPIIQACPDTLQFLQIQIEHTRHIRLSLCVGRPNHLRAFQYSYLQIKRRVGQGAIAAANIIHINTDFLILDRYDFEQFYFEIAGILELAGCHEFLNKFNRIKVIRGNIKNENELIQNFNLSVNLISNQLKIVDLTLENIILNTERFAVQNLTKLRLVLRRCQINIQTLTATLNQLNQGTELFIDMRQQEQNQRFTQQQQRNLLRNLQNKKLQVKILIPEI